MALLAFAFEEEVELVEQDYSLLQSLTNRLSVSKGTKLAVGLPAGMQLKSMSVFCNLNEQLSADSVAEAVVAGQEPREETSYPRAVPHPTRVQNLVG